jgi:hypothetical protein
VKKGATMPANLGRAIEGDRPDEVPEMPKRDFCINCDRVVDWYYTGEKGWKFGLCTACKEAFELGQANPNAEIVKRKKRGET